jgi:hypothetical protein
MKNSHKKTLQKIFANPQTGQINWKDIDALFLSLGVEKSQGNGSRVHFFYKDEMITFHVPHSRKEAQKYQVKYAKKFLETIGVKP